MTNNNLIEYANLLLSIAVQKCGNLEDGADLVQDTLLAGLVAIHNGQTIENPKAWLITVLHTKFNMWLRQKYKKPTINFQAMEMEPVSEYDFLEEVIKQEEVQAIQKELAYLTKIYREVVIRFYIKNQNINQIAKELKIPSGTVKRRLYMGREHIREGIMNMKSLVKQSYEPDTLFLTCTGTMGMNGEPHSIIRDDKIAQNVLLIAYDKPLTTYEIATAIGIPTVYLEPIIDSLVKQEVMRRRKDQTVYTDFIIFKETDRIAVFKEQYNLATKSFQLFWNSLSTGLTALKETTFYKKQDIYQREKMESYFGIKALMTAIPKGRPASISYDCPIRPNGGRWCAMGNMYPSDYDYTSTNHNKWDKYCVSGEIGVNFYNYHVTSILRLVDYDTELGKTHSALDCDDEKVLKLFYAIVKDGEHIEKVLEDTGDMELLKYLPKLEELYLIKQKEKELFTVTIPILNENEFKELRSRIDITANEIYKQIKDSTKCLYEKGKVQYPKHIVGILPWIPYMWCDTFLPMMVLEESRKRGLFLNKVDHPCQAMLMVVD